MVQDLVEIRSVQYERAEYSSLRQLRGGELFVAVSHRSADVPDKLNYVVLRYFDHLEDSGLHQNISWETARLVEPVVSMKRKRGIAICSEISDLFWTMSLLKHLSDLPIKLRPDSINDISNKLSLFRYSVPFHGAPFPDQERIR